MRRRLCGLIYLSASTYLLSDSGVVLSGSGEATVRLTLVSTVSASRGILSYILKIYNFLYLLFLILTICTIILTNFTGICEGALEIILAWIQEKKYELETTSSGVCRYMG
jgi:hypothetical protein